MCFDGIVDVTPILLFDLRAPRLGGAPLSGLIDRNTNEHHMFPDFVDKMIRLCRLSSVQTAKEIVHGLSYEQLNRVLPQASQVGKYKHLVLVDLDEVSGFCSDTCTINW